MKRKIMIASGGTAGHVFPAISLTRSLLERGHSVYFVSDERCRGLFEYEKFHSSPNFHLKLISISSRKMPFFMWNILKSIVSIVYFIISNKIHGSVGFGSYVSFVGSIASFLTLRPLAIHEQNICMGRANKISSLFAKFCMLGMGSEDSFPWFVRMKAVKTGNPVRQSIQKHRYENNISNINYKSMFEPKKGFNILVIGGSQGCNAFDEVMPKTISMIPQDIKAEISVFHQSSQNNVIKVNKAYNSYRIFADVRPFFTDIGSLMSKCHLMICRSGASTIAEITTIGTPSVLVPYPYATNDHQLKNAQYLYNKGAAFLIEENDLSAGKLSGLIDELFINTQNLYNVSLNAKSLCQTNANEKMVLVIERMLGVKNDDQYISEYGQTQIKIRERGVHGDIGTS